ncbi:basic phospholipase A2 caudoxin-like [Asterias amurensis]|uniref:basic phospholipase A2 caudoxin-like n=1 Tax=Asterias amurensis TaxID=7602 RepID=UPI003AB2988C
MENARRWSVLFVVVMASAVVSGVKADESKVRIPRNVMELGGMVGKVTGKNIFDVYSSYNGYGCFCGIGGGGRPVDGVDRCCQAHDSCFGDAEKGVCSHAKSIYDVKYDYHSKGSTSNGNHVMVRCAPVSTYSNTGDGTCSKTICECDKALSFCFTEQKYNNKYRGYDRNKCK